jgi:DNA-damage-inducible protein J
MAQVNIRVDDNLKEQAEKLFDGLGLNLTTAISAFLVQAVRVRGIPFELTTRDDPFYSESNMKALRQSIQEANEGKFVSKTMDELLAMEEDHQ